MNCAASDGQAAAELYDYLKSETDYPVDDLLRALLPVQPLAAMAQTCTGIISCRKRPGECAPVLLDATLWQKAAPCSRMPSTACRCRVLPG